VFNVLTNSTGARRQPMILGITTAGFDRETPCYRLYEHGKKVEVDPDFDPHFYFQWIEAPAGADHRDPETWRKANPSFNTTVRQEFFADQLSKKPENIFRRYFLNQWTLSEQSWLPPGAWDACRGDVVIDPTTPTVVGVDMALRHDSVAVVWCQLHDGVAHVRSRVWNPQGDRIDIEAIENHIRTLHRELNVVEVSFDPAYFERSAQVLLDQGVPMVEFPQSPSRMVPACQGAYEAIVQQRVVHDGDPTLADHVLSAAQRESERGWTLSKGRSKRKIDAVIALVIALHEASQPSEPASIYESRGLVVLG
jgi:phage terminase large subunit-like protein